MSFRFPKLSVFFNLFFSVHTILQQIVLNYQHGQTFHFQIWFLSMNERLNNKIILVVVETIRTFIISTPSPLSHCETPEK